MATKLFQLVVKVHGPLDHHSFHSFGHAVRHALALLGGHDTGFEGAEAWLNTLAHKDLFVSLSFLNLEVELTLVCLGPVEHSKL